MLSPSILIRRTKGLVPEMAPLMGWEFLDHGAGASCIPHGSEYCVLLGLQFHDPPIRFLIMLLFAKDMII